MSIFRVHFYRILAGCPESGYLLTGLKTEIGAVAGRRPGDDEMKELVQDAKRAGHIEVTPDPLFGSDRISLTPDGMLVAERL